MALRFSCVSAFGRSTLVCVRMPETRYARSGDVMVAYQVVGEGPFDVVIVPGSVSHVELGVAGQRYRARAQPWKARPARAGPHRAAPLINKAH